MVTPQFNSAMARFRADFCKKIRAFFEKRSVVEIETPVLSRGISCDCHIDVFSTRYFPDGTAEGLPFYLQTSPEFHMKRLLAGGFPDIFQISRVFRNGEKGRLHNPEFTMLEWYRRAYTLEQLMDEVAALCDELTGSFPVVKKPYRQAFQEATGINPVTTSYDDLLDYCRSRNLSPPPLPSITDALQFLMATCVEPFLPEDTYVFLYHFPAAQALLARLNPRDTRIAQRFEVYFNGIELGNGYEELVDWRETMHRMHEENKKRSQARKQALPVDEQFINSLRKGIGPCAGVAMGVDRMIMLSAGASSVQDVIAFPWDCC